MFEIGDALGERRFRRRKGETFLFSQRGPGPEIQDIVLAKLGPPGERPKVISHDVSRENIKSLVGAGFISLLQERYLSLPVGDAAAAPSRRGASLMIDL